MSAVPAALSGPPGCGDVLDEPGDRVGPQLVERDGGASQFPGEFPGETEAEFAETLSLVDAVGYAQAYSFKYSPRPGTPAATLNGQVPPEAMDERLQRLQAALARDQAAFNAASVGRACSVLIERQGKLPGQMLGKSPWLQSVHLMTDARIGDLVEVEIVRADPNSLAGVERVKAAA